MISQSPLLKQASFYVIGLKIHIMLEEEHLVSDSGRDVFTKSKKNTGV